MTALLDFVFGKGKEKEKQKKEEHEEEEKTTASSKLPKDINNPSSTYDRTMLEDNTLTDQLMSNTLLVDTSKNVIMSPLSIESALSVAFAGAQQNTLSEYWKVVHPSASKDSSEKAMDYALNYLALAETYQKQYPMEQAEDEGKTKDAATEQKVAPYIMVANRVYVFTKNMNPEYQEKLSSVVTNELNQPSLSPSDKAQKVNSWVSTNTNQKIKEIVEPSMFDANLKLLIVNSVYFHATFEKPFDPQNTKDNIPFYEDYQRKSVRNQNITMMTHKNVRFEYIEDFKNYEMVMMKYANSNFRLILARPTKNDLATLGVKDIISMNWTTDNSINLRLPKFTYDYSKELTTILKDKIKIDDAFTDKANFEGMAKEEGLRIDAVIHKAMVEMNEKGTTAAAATAIRMATRSLIQPSKSKDVIFDHPFDFFIWDESNRIILFAGRVINPIAR